MYRVRVKRDASRKMEKAPEEIKILFGQLVQDLAERGPVLPKWPKYSKLGKGKYHCHLAYHWVACWYCKADSVLIEVYYAGSRESAPY
jgi:hypothetical protein